MEKAALLISNNLRPFIKEPSADTYGINAQIKTLRSAFAVHDIKLETCLWQEAPEAAPNYAAMMPLMAWDYAEGQQAQFLKVMKVVTAQTRLLNSYELLAWNADKIYLEALAAKGVPIIPALCVDKITEGNVEDAFSALKADHIIIKPRIGAGAWRQVSLKRGQPLPSTSELPPAGALIQPFQTYIQTEGEYSLLYFDGEFSHALIKRAKSGDYRIQSIYGGTEQAVTPTAKQLSVAERVLGTLPETPLYARIDLLRGNDGSFKLIELELIEPDLYLPYAQTIGAENQGALKLARAVHNRIDRF